MKMPRFDQGTMDRIINRLEELKSDPKKYSKRYKIIADEINEDLKENHYDPKQIRQLYEENLKPNLCKDPLDDDEKDFIILWVINEGFFSATQLISAIQRKF